LAGGAGSEHVRGPHRLRAPLRVVRRGPAGAGVDRRAAGGPDHRPRPGLLDMVRAIHEGRPHVATGEVGYHVLDIMLSAEESAERGEFVTVDSSVSEIPAVPADFDPKASTI